MTSQSFPPPPGAWYPQQPSVPAQQQPPTYQQPAVAHPPPPGYAQPQPGVQVLPSNAPVPSGAQVVYEQPAPAWGPPSGQHTAAHGMPGAQPPPMPQVAALPAIHMPDEQVVAAAYRRAQEEAERVAKARAGGGGDLPFFHVPGPVGQTKWDGTVPVGYQGRAVLWLCSAWAPGLMPWQEATSHWYRCARVPQGTSVTCVGKERCPICYSRNLLFRAGDEASAQKARSTGKARHNVYYNVLDLDHPQGHVRSDGKMTPWIFRASSSLHQDIVRNCQELGLNAVMNPAAGRPVVVSKVKKGPQDMDVEWGVVLRNETQLPQVFWPALYCLWDLSRLVKMPTGGEVMQALQDMQLPYDQQVANLVAQLPQAQPPAPPPGHAPGMPAGYPYPQMVHPQSPWGQAQGPVSAALQGQQYPGVQTQPSGQQMPVNYQALQQQVLGQR